MLQSFPLNYSPDFQYIDIGIDMDMSFEAPVYRGPLEKQFDEAIAAKLVIPTEVVSMHWWRPVDISSATLSRRNSAALAKSGLQRPAFGRSKSYYSLADQYNRDFNNIECLRSDYYDVIANPGSYCHLNSYGGGAYVSWYFYHSVANKRCYIMWQSDFKTGFRTDVDRISVLDSNV